MLLILLLFLLLYSFSSSYYYKSWSYGSYVPFHICCALPVQISTLVGMWLIPVVLSLQFHWWRFITVWTIFSIITGFVSFKATRKPIAGTTPRSDISRKCVQLSSVCVNVLLKKGKGVCIAIYGNPSHNYGVSLAIWDHTVLPSTRHKRTHPASNPARQAGTRFTDHLRMEGWVSPGAGCKEQLAHGCYATARASETRTHNLSITSWAR